jgi:hypothetical protein
MKAKIDNVDYTAKFVAGFQTQGKILLTGAEADGTKTLGLQVPADIITGTYDFTLFGDYIALYAPTPQNAMVSESGKLIILEHNTASKKIRGSFNFKGRNIQTAESIVVSNGFFSITYQ